MADIKKYSKGDILYYLGRTKCEVVRNTLKAGGVNADEATLFLRVIGSGSCHAVPVAEQELFVSETKIAFMRTWPPAPTR